MFEKTIYCVVWWDGKKARTENFIKSKNADAFEKNVRKSGLFITRTQWYVKSDIQYNVLATRCYDYEWREK